MTNKSKTMAEFFAEEEEKRLNEWNAEQDKERERFEALTPEQREEERAAAAAKWDKWSDIFDAQEAEEVEDSEDEEENEDE